jgi:hypothetical protein
MATDALMDLILKIGSQLTVVYHLRERIIFVVVLGAPSVAYLFIRSSPIVTTILAALFATANIAINFAIHNKGSKSLIPLIISHIMSL